MWIGAAPPCDPPMDRADHPPRYGTWYRSSPPALSQSRRVALALRTAQIQRVRQAITKLPISFVQDSPQRAVVAVWLGAVCAGSLLAASLDCRAFSVRR